MASIDRDVSTDSLLNGEVFFHSYREDPETVLARLDELLTELGVTPRSVEELADVFQWESDHAREEFVRLNTSRGEGGDRASRHAGEELTSAADLNEFLQDSGHLGAE